MESGTTAKKTKNAWQTLKRDWRFRKRNTAQGAIHAPAQRSQSRYLDTSCSSRMFLVAQTGGICKTKLFTVI
jgi:hypothetical protein